ncbi:MAG TPA: radical SAM protein [bacterium]|nr:radical SAM protein [bacterium]
MIDRHDNYGLYGHKKKDFTLREEEVFMKVIYEPAGRAKEYCDLALNIYTGCDHACKYCYAPQVIHRTREEYKNVYPRKQILTNVRNEAHQFKGREVLLSFISDPYPTLEIEYKVTRRIIETFVKEGVVPVILTKSSFADRDFDLLKQANGRYGTTLTFSDEIKSKEWEPGAGTPAERILNLRKAKEQGIRTWVSLEPVIVPKETLKIIDLTWEFVDEYKVGKLNYLPEAQRIDWEWFLKNVKEKLDGYGKTYYIKRDLAKFGEGGN